MALPGLVSRILHERLKRFEVIITGTPMRLDRGRFDQKFDDYERALQFLAYANDAILVVLDSDDDDPHELAYGLEKRALEIVGHRSVRVAPAVMEFEAWFLASLPELQGMGDVASDATCETNPESFSGAKGQFAKRLTTGRYSETVDQRKYAGLMDLAAAERRSASFAGLLRSIDEVTS